MKKRVRRCPRCGETNKVKFGKHHRAPDGLNNVCLVCARQAKALYDKHQKEKDSEGFLRRKREYLKEWLRKNPEKQRQYDFRDSYGITLKQFDDLLEEQNHRCAICRKTAKESPHRGIDRLVVDHDHTTGVVRGILCGKCNIGLGHFLDDVYLLGQAAKYLLANGKVW